MYIPLFIDISQWQILIIGGGAIALRKARDLAQGKAAITLIAPQRCAGWEDLEVNWLPCEYREQDFTGYDLVIAASNSEELNKAIAIAAKDQGILCNCASHSEKGNVIIPGVVRENGITVALSTEGKAPFLTKQLKGEAKKITARYNQENIELLGNIRRDILERYPDNKEKLLKKLANTPLKILQEKGNCHEITDWLQRE